MSRKVEELTAEQRSKLAELSVLTGIEDHQELLNKMPDIAETIVEAFYPVTQAIIVMGNRMMAAWNDLPPETHAAIQKYMDQHENH